MNLQVEAFLDDHPDFTESYVLRKVKRSTIDKWLVKNTHTDEEDHLPVKLLVNTLSTQDSEDLEQESSECKSKDRVPPYKRSQSLTPHRKISVATFAGVHNSPLLTTSEDGSLSFLTVPSN